MRKRIETDGGMTWKRRAALTAPRYLTIHFLISSRHAKIRTLSGIRSVKFQLTQRGTYPLVNLKYLTVKTTQYDHNVFRFLDCSITLEAIIFCGGCSGEETHFFIVLKRFTQREKEDKVLSCGNSAPMSNPHAILIPGYMFARQ